MSLRGRIERVKPKENVQFPAEKVNLILRKNSNKSD